MEINKIKILKKYSNLTVIVTYATVPRKVIYNAWKHKERNKNNNMDEEKKG